MDTIFWRRVESNSGWMGESQAQAKTSRDPYPGVF